MLAKISIALFVALVGCTSGAPLSDDKIIGGFPVNITQTPWQVALVFKGRQMCGGSIISNRWILTAAHCTSGIIFPEDYKWLVGTEDITKGGMTYAIKSYVSHRSYNRKTIDYDYALFELAEELEFNERVQPVQLPKVDDEHIPTGSTVLVSGWGKLKAHHPTGTRHLHAVALPTVDQEDCTLIYEKINRVTDRMMCAGLVQEGGKNACNGDSGGPVVHFDSETKVPTVVGIVSWGIADCARPGYPGVYARVLTARKWIHEKIGI